MLTLNKSNLAETLIHTTCVIIILMGITALITLGTMLYYYSIGNITACLLFATWTFWLCITAVSILFLLIVIDSVVTVFIERLKRKKY